MKWKIESDGVQTPTDCWINKINLCGEKQE